MRWGWSGRESEGGAATPGDRIDNHIHALSLYFVFYNFCRLHKTLGITPAMQMGLTTVTHDMDWIAGLIDARAPKPGPRGPYKAGKRLTD